MNLEEIPVVILAGGRGARFDYESQVKPKPMIEVAGKPILEHIIDGFMAQGLRRFVVAVGYLGDRVSEYFREHPDYFLISDGPDGVVFGRYLNGPCTVVIVDTGEDSHTGERLWRLREVIGRHRFILTYGDGLSDVDMTKVMKLHEKDSRDTKIWWGAERPEETVPALITVTSAKPAARFGAIEFVNCDDWGIGEVRSFQEKPRDSWINGGFMVIEPEFITKYLSGDQTPQLESGAMRACAEDGFMRAYRHTGYWRCMDTRRDLEQIEADVKANNGNLPWMRDR